MPTFRRRSLKSRTSLRRRRAPMSKARARAINRRRFSRRRPIPRPLWTKKSTVMRLTYSQEVSVDAPSGGIAYHSFRTNSCHDPDLTGIGHQPRYWDLVTPGWRRYCVLGSKIRAQFMPTTTSTAVQPGAFFIIETGGTGQPYSSAADAREDRVRIHSSGPIDGPTRYATKTWSLKKLTGTKASAGDDEYTALVGSNPLTQRYFHLCAASLAGGDALAMTFIVTIDYIVRLDNGYADVGDS